MAELTQPDVYSLRTLQVWKTLLNWLAFFFQIFVQILRAFGHLRLLSSSDSDSSSPSFKPLPAVELPDHEFLAASAVDISSVEDEEESDGLMEKLTIVLDLDETLICAYETSTLPAVIRNQAIEAGLKCFELECFSSDKDCEGKPKVNYVTVFERPGLHDFLNQLGSFADLVLFTAGLEGLYTLLSIILSSNILAHNRKMKENLKDVIYVYASGYARPLVDRIDEENRFSLRLYRPSTISTEYRDHVKDLSCLSKDLRRTVIVDNNPFSFLLQPVNGIPCIPFSAGQPHDSQLLDVILPLLKHLSLQNDVRSVLYERFHMPEWFQKHGIPT
ncbi:CTD nuclear envelope phosphatase 1 homolog isoform X1 [Cucurbita maxima]|uniref:Mitochondrial import inner membrane translocase subunit TIM50 n=1 Tax=Cucurbita maxima TaxID=3661 RepID=A0A6J1K5W1_CUCMA|nr:CTD nuclear envelope phosphatase 1 homolog isoform X1 [Cucurbita maxima]